MAGQRITKRIVQGLKPKAAEFIVWDATLPGFGVRVRPTGTKTYVAMYRAGAGRGAPLRRMTLGATSKLAPEDARKLAKATLGAVARGDDPAANRTAERRAATLSDLAALFLSEHVEGKRKATTAAFYRSILDRTVLPEMGGRRAEKIATADIARLHMRLRKTPYQANRMLAVVASLYAFAARRKLVPAGFNPVKGIEKYPEKGRERFLSGDELARLGEAIREAETIGIVRQFDRTKPKAKHAPKIEQRTIIDRYAAAAIRLLILTGARLREILTLRWDYVDFERGLLLLPDSKTGKKAIVLNAPALAVLSGLERIGGYVIASTSAGTKDERPRADLNRPWRTIAKRAGLAKLRIHDLRHTHASFGAGAGLGLPIIGKLLGHTQASTTQRYAHLDNDPLRRASEKIGGQLAAAMGEALAGGAEIVPFASGGGRRAANV